MRLKFGYDFYELQGIVPQTTGSYEEQTWRTGVSADKTSSKESIPKDWSTNIIFQPETHAEV